MVYNPLGGGLLSGRHQFTERPTSGRFGDSRLAAMYTDRYWNAELFAGIEALTEIADQAGLPLSALALRWLLGQDRVSSVLLGGSKISHLRSQSRRRRSRAAARRRDRGLRRGRASDCVARCPPTTARC